MVERQREVGGQRDLGLLGGEVGKELLLLLTVSLEGAGQAAPGYQQEVGYALLRQDRVQTVRVRASVEYNERRNRIR